MYDFIGSVDFRQIFQFDVRGTNEVIGSTNIDITIGEIKSGEDKKCAIIQVIERLLIIRKAAICMTDMPSNNIHLRGEIFTNIIKWKDTPVSNQDLKSILKIKESIINEIFPITPGVVNAWLIVDIEVIGST